MKTCSMGHDRIAFGAADCPLCAMRVERDDAVASAATAQLVVAALARSLNEIHGRDSDSIKQELEYDAAVIETDKINRAGYIAVGSTWTEVMDDLLRKEALACKASAG